VAAPNTLETNRLLPSAPALLTVRDLVVHYHTSRGAVLAEVGDVDLVVKHPKHPYTELLIHSIPQANPNHPWQSHELSANGSAAGAVGPEHCQFVARCPFAMEMCRQQTPPLFRTDQRRAAACFLYREDPVLRDETLDDVLATPVPAEV
jgi:oligopeptide/dipeptide ABC transporter ATP-binding protein